MAAAYTRAIIGRGCDPVRAAHTKNWEPLLQVRVDCCTSDAELLKTVGTPGVKYEAFFVAPGACSLMRGGAWDGEAVIERVRQLQPGIKVLLIEDVTHGLQQLARVLGLKEELKETKPLSADWPFVD